MSRREPSSRWIVWPLGLIAALACAVYFSWTVYAPDRPAPTLVPGSSSGPAFVVQILRPRVGLPVGGLLPPRVFGLDAALGFDTGSSGAGYGRIERDRLELVADGWDLVFVLDPGGRPAPGTEVAFELLFQDRLQAVRCRPADPPVGDFELTALPASSELSGHFHLELAHCDRADTGKPLGWPAQPLILHGSFDRLPLSTSRPTT